MQVSPSQPPGPAVLSVVIVNYRSWPDVLRLVGSLVESPSVASGACEVVVVDNASPEPIPSDLLTPGPGLRLILRPENGGFSSGVNAGWRASTGPWLLVLNPDVVPGPGFLEQVLGRIDRLEGPTGVVGFGLRNPDGSRQPSVGAFPGLARTAWEQLIPRYRRKYQPEWRLRPGPVDWVTGACMLLDSRMLEELGGMDEDFFLYYEEVALCRSARDRGWIVEYDPGVSVVHLRPLQNRAISPKMRVITRHSKLLYFRKHRPTWQFAALGAAVRLEARLRGAWCRARSRPEEARSWRAVERAAKLLEAGADLKGRAVLELAEAVEEPAEDLEEPDADARVPAARDSPGPTRGRSHGSRALQPRKDGPSMTTRSHAARLVLLMACAGGLLGWTGKNSAILFADGLRYIDQAKRLDAGNTSQALFRSIDHPAYPLAVAAMHRVLGGNGPVDWQLAAQGASIAAGVLLVIPLYLVALEMFGASTAWLAVVLSFLVPLTGHVMADTLSESLFLLFFTWGVWTSLRFLREGTFPWLPPTVGFAALAYWVRPEGLLLPASMVATLALVPLLRSPRMLWPRWWAAVGFLVIGPACLIAPIVATKGGLSTKPAVGRWLGTAPNSAPRAVERTRPLDPGQTTAQTYVLATRAMAIAVRDSVTIPLLPLALLGFVFAWPPGDRTRPWVFFATLMIAWALALIRLHATGGYCTPRHAMILTYPMIASAAFGLDRLLRMIAIPGRWVGQADGRYTLGPIAWVAALVGLAISYKAELVAPINGQFAGYRQAADYVASHVPTNEKVVDLTGWSLYYGQREGYTFANLIEARGDEGVTRVVVRDAHLKGPWEYCRLIHELIGDRKPVASYPEHPVDKQSVVFVYDWSDPANRTARGPAPETR